MKKAKGFLSFGLPVMFFAGSLAVVLVGTNMNKSFFKGAVGDPVTYSMTVDYDAVADEALSSSFQNNVVEESLENGSYTLSLHYVNAKRSSDELVTLANYGRVYNTGAANKVAGLTSITVDFSGTLYLQTSLSKTELLMGSYSVLTSGSKMNISGAPYYFMLTAGEQTTTIQSITFEYTCEESNAIDAASLNGVYTGVGQDASTYKLTIANPNVVIESLDKASNISINGTYAMVDADTVKCSFVFNTLDVDYTFDVSSDLSEMTFVSKTGAGAAYVTQISKLNKVYTVENFESYTQSGQGYTDSTKKYQTTGMRAAFYADYYTGSSTSEIGGSGWQLMTSTDNTNYNGSKGHNGSKVGIFKFSSGNGMRYMSMNELYGVPAVIGKGTVLSFWARGAYTNQNYNTNHASNTPMKMYAFYTTPLTPGTQSTREEMEFTVQAGSEWQHFEMPLTAGRTYLGFGFYAKQTSGSAQYLPIDDVEIYTASPYATYVAPVAVTGVSVAPTALELTTGGHSQLTATVAPNDATNKNVTWTSNNTSVATVDETGNVSAVTPGNATITVTTVDGGFTATCAVTVSAPAGNYPEGTFWATISNYKLVIAIGNETNGLVAVRVSTTDAVATGISYNSGNHTFTITTTGSVGGYTVGNITGTYDVANDRLTGVNCSGQIGAAISDVTLNRPSNGSFYNCDDSTATLQNTFGRRYRSKGASSWSNDTSNADRIQSDTTHHVSGEGGMSVRPCGNSYDAYGFVLKSDYASAKTVANIHFWVYNPCAYDITFRAWYYKATNFGTNGQIGLGSADIAKAGTWTYVSRGFTSSAIYNFTLSVWTADQTQAATSMSARLVFDDVFLY